MARSKDDKTGGHHDDKTEDRCPNCGYCPHCGQSTKPRPEHLSISNEYVSRRNEATG